MSECVHCMENPRMKISCGISMRVTCVEHTSHVYSTLWGNVVHANFCHGTTCVHACKCEVIIEWYCRWVKRIRNISLLFHCHVYKYIFLFYVAYCGAFWLCMLSSSFTLRRFANSTASLATVFYILLTLYQSKVIRNILLLNASYMSRWLKTKLKQWHF